jgi:dehydrogenase/reductase SDR family protein 12
LGLFFRTGYWKHVKQYKEPYQTTAHIAAGAAGNDGVDMTGKVVVVTGANSGLGKAVATYAASKGAKLFMMCRSADRAAAAKQEISDLTGNTDIQVVLCNVAEMKNIRTAVKELQSKTDKIDCLVCNAGALLNDKQESSEGYELTFASHLLGGAYLLPKLLLPQLQAAGGNGRCVFVTSGGMYNFKFPSWEVATSQKGTYNGVNVYAYAKRGQVLLAERFAVEYPDVAWVTVHPGWTDTPAVEEAFGDKKKYLAPLREPWQGAEGMAWLTQTSKENLTNGAFYLDRIPQTKHLGGPFFSEGSFTKNKPKEVDEMMANLKKAAGV